MRKTNIFLYFSLQVFTSLPCVGGKLERQSTGSLSENPRVTILAINHSNPEATLKQKQQALENYQNVSAYLSELDLGRPQFILIEGFPNSEGNFTQEHEMFPAIAQHLQKESFKILSWDNLALSQIHGVSQQGAAKRNEEIKVSPTKESYQKLAANLSRSDLTGVSRSYFMAKKILEVYEANPDANISVVCGSVHGFDGIAHLMLSRAGISYQVLASNEDAKFAKDAVARIKSADIYERIARVSKDPSIARDVVMKKALDEIADLTRKFSDMKLAGERSADLEFREKLLQKDARDYLRNCKDCSCLFQQLNYVK